MGERRAEVLQSAYATEVPDQRTRHLLIKMQTSNLDARMASLDKAYKVIR
jgi:hypothetical protein